MIAPAESTSRAGAAIARQIEALPVGRLQKLVCALILYVCFVDGFDSAVIAIAGPLLQTELSLSAPQLGASFSATLAGGMVALLFAGPVADRIGRRRVIVAAAICFTLCTIATPLAWDATSLFVIRLAAGLGLGAVPALGFSLVGEFMPRRLASRTITLAASGYVMGTIVAGFVGASILRTWDWPALFFIGGALGVSSVATLLLWLPESPEFLARDPQSRQRLVQLLGRISPEIRLDPVEAERSQGPAREGIAASIPKLFREGRGPITLLFWTFGFMILLEQFFLVHWLPTLLASVGTPIEITSLANAALHIGALVGTFGLASVLDTTRRRYLIMAAAAAWGGVLVFILGQFTSGGIGMLLVAVLAGIGVIGPAIANPSLLVRFYPAEMRATGVTYNSAVGRIGALLGPIIGGYMLHAGMDPGEIISWMSLPAVVAVIAYVVMDRVHAEART